MVRNRNQSLLSLPAIYCQSDCKHKKRDTECWMYQRMQQRNNCNRTTWALRQFCWTFVLFIYFLSVVRATPWGLSPFKIHRRYERLMLCEQPDIYWLDLQYAIYKCADTSLVATSAYDTASCNCYCYHKCFNASRLLNACKLLMCESTNFCTQTLSVLAYSRHMWWWCDDGERRKFNENYSFDGKINRS